MASVRYPSFVVTLLFGAFLFLQTHFDEAGRIFNEPPPVPHEFVQTNGSYFQLNGSPFLFNGFNSYWMLSLASDSTQRFKVSNIFQKASALGLAVCRTWAFNDGGYQALQVSPGVYNESVFQALDFVVGEAKRYGVKLILALVNNYKDYGGRPQYVQWARNAGTFVGNDDEFYTNPVIKDYYKNHVKNVLTRINTITGIAYKDEPTIMAWELINEPRCQVDSSGNTLTAWVQEMAPYVKSIDRNHLLGVGMEGFYGDSIPDRKQYNVNGYQVGTDFITNNQINEIDFTTIHAYPDIWLAGQSDYAQMEFMQRWITSHWNDSMTILKKPIVFAEFGKSKKDPSYNISSRDSFMVSVYSSIYSLAQKGGSFGGGLVWQLLDVGMDLNDDGYGIVLPQDTSTCSVITQQSNKMAALGH